MIGETPDRATSPSGAADVPALTKAITSAILTSYDELAASPLASWIESTFGLATEPGTGRLVRQTPRRLQEDAAPALANATNDPIQDCHDTIRQALLTGSRVRDAETGRPLFAFRLHQFLSKGDTLHVSLEPGDSRYITSKYQVAVPSAPEKLLFPLAFCRECGQEYAVVKRITRGGETTYAPRSSRDVTAGDAVDGYLYVSTDFPGGGSDQRGPSARLVGRPR